MKQCPQCQEEFADKFGFCPVDGTPLDVAVAAPVETRAADESVVTVSAPPAGPSSSNGSHASNGSGTHTAAGAGSAPPNVGDGRAELHLTFLEDEGLTRRLIKELKSVGHDAELTWPEFKRDPVGFTKRSAKAYGAAGQKFLKQDNTVPAVVAPFIVAVIVAGVWAGIVFRCNLMNAFGRQCVQSVSENPYENLELVGYVENEIPKEQPTPEKGNAGTNEGKGGGSKPKYEKPAGGGGGGR
ncbi:MAG TPA: hypothetical protein VF654_02665, partial [Pyrinomonadaceae bacterium]